MLVAGAGYALYRANLGIQDQVRSLLGLAAPGAEGNLRRAGADIKGAAQGGLDGDDSRSKLKDASGELKRAGEQTVDAAGDMLGDLKRDASRKIDDLEH